MSDIYNPGQFDVILPYVKKIPQWLILGGPANGNEAQCAIRKWPMIKVVGVEPAPEMIEWQKAHGWRMTDYLFQSALSDRSGTTTMRHRVDDPKCSSLMMDRPGEEKPVTLETIDRLASALRIVNAVIWLDIEGYEIKALNGARDFFSQGRALAVNVELIYRLEENTRLIELFFAEYGYKLAHTWNIQPGLCEDRIYIPDPKRKR